jgi:alpha-galactosidase
MEETAALRTRLIREIEELAAGKTGCPESLRRFGPTFRYGGMLMGRNFETAVRKSLPDRDVYELVQTSPDQVIRFTLKITLYRDFPAVEWLPVLENIGTRDSFQISDFQSLDAAIPVSPCEFVRLGRNFGSLARQDDFLPEELMLGSRIRSEVVMECTDGRSSKDFLPFFSLRSDGRWFHQYAIGWSGAWKCRFTVDDENLSVRCGLRKTDFYLRPGEKVRQASFVLLEHDPDCDPDDAQNVFRHFMLTCHSPRDSRGEIISAPLSFTCGGNVPEKMLTGMLDLIGREKLPFELLWMDAGWFGEDREPYPFRTPLIVGGMMNDTLGQWHHSVGNWRVNRGVHPHGLKPYSDLAARCGMKFMLWFEIERTAKTAPLAKEHPELLLRIPNAEEYLLLDLGRPEARKWALDTIKARIAEDGVSMIRIDFNVNPLTAWAEADEPNRIGLTETYYIMGLYELWDELRKLLPDAAIDNCASGGRRLDFEALTRSIALWRVDGRQTPESHQLQVSELSKWVPINSAGLGGNPTPVGSDYTLLSLCGNPSMFSYFTEEMAADPEWFRRIGARVRKLRPLFMQRLYHLTGQVWNTREFHALECLSFDGTSGAVLAFRRPDTPKSSLSLVLRNIERAAAYELTGHDGSTRDISGAELEHLTLDFPVPGSVQLLFFQKKP